MDAPDFAAPVVHAMDKSLPTFHLLKQFPLIRKAVFSLPPWLAIKVSPTTAGLTHLQKILSGQVKDVTANSDILEEAPYPTIYHRLLDPAAQKGNPVPNATSLYEEAQSMMFAGGVTVGDTLMIGHFHILDQPLLYQRLRAEVCAVWPNIDSPPNLEVLEALPTLTACIKETLRISPGVCSPLLRVVPPTGGMISGKWIPGGTIVGMSSVFVHKSSIIFANPDSFEPDRWLDKDATNLDRWLVAFSKGPRSCLGVNLAWCELYIAFATMLRLFEMSLDGTTSEDLIWRDCFTPHFYSRHLRVWCRPTTA